MKRILFIIATITLITFTACQKEDGATITPRVNDKPHAETPRFLAGAGGKIYATCYNPCCIVRIDTATLQVEAMCKLGQYHPEGICAIGNKLYIASGSISDESSNWYYDNKIYIVDIATFSVVDSIATGYNPERIAALDNHRIIVSYHGDYATHPEGCDIIDIDTKTATTLTVPLYKLDIYQGDIYGYTNTYDDMWNVTNQFYRIDGDTYAETEILTDFSPMDHVYGLNLNPHNGDIIIMTDGNYMNNGDVYVYRNDGNLRHSAKEATSLPSKAVNINESTLMILCEGNWGYNDADISVYDCVNGTISNNAFSQSNGRGLGDVGQDILVYGGKVYAAITFSNSIEVIERSSQVRSKQILL